MKNLPPKTTDILRKRTFSRKTHSICLFLKAIFSRKNTRNDRFTKRNGTINLLFSLEVIETPVTRANLWLAELDFYFSGIFQKTKMGSFKRDTESDIPRVTVSNAQRLCWHNKWFWWSEWKPTRNNTFVVLRYRCRWGVTVTDQIPTEDLILVDFLSDFSASMKAVSIF